MARIFLVRHGEYSGTFRNLTPVGRTQVEMTANKLKKLINVEEIVIASSHIPRAVETSEILSKVLGVNGVRVESSLGQEGAHINQEEYKKINEFVLPLLDSYPDIILSTHQAVTTSYPAFFTEEKFGLRQFFSPLDYGGVICIDLERKVARPLEMLDL